ncbi:hypothetical protein GGI12_005555 [Dipsacomyces acuminosporus]|nr:hypothetical protein GGI12_005555 [Dipsacomyces acuminosporus]
MADNNNNQESGAASNLAAKELPSSSTSPPTSSAVSSSDLDKLNTTQKFERRVLSVSEQLVLIEEVLPLYSGGGEESMSSDTWTKRAENWASELLYSTSPGTAVALLRKRLTGDAKAAVIRDDCNTPRALLDTLKTAFPKLPFQIRLVQRLESGEAIRGMTRQNAFMMLTDILQEVSDVSFGTMAVADATQKLFPAHWMHMRVNSCTASAEEIGEALKELECMLQVDKLATPQLYGKAKASAASTPTDPNTSAGPTKKQRKRNKTNKIRQEWEEKFDLLTKALINNGSLAAPPKVVSTQVAEKPAARASSGKD